MQINTKTLKSELRSDFLNKLNQMSKEQKALASENIQNNLQKNLSNESGLWGAFQNLSNEPAIEWNQVSAQIQWCFPKIENEQIVFKSKVTSFLRSEFGVKEPQDGEKTEVTELKGVIVPALAFSQKGHRLGRGKAFYDQSLKKYNGKKIGVCFDLSLQKELPIEEHDILFHQIVTESSIYQVEHSEGDSKWN